MENIVGAELLLEHLEQLPNNILGIIKMALVEFHLRRWLEEQIHLNIEIITYKYNYNRHSFAVLNK
jgi:hypothetical protein